VAQKTVSCAQKSKMLIPDLYCCQNTNTGAMTKPHVKYV